MEYGWLIRRRSVEVALLLFALSFGVRLLLDLLFLLHFGWHAVNHAETWLYVGVLAGGKTTGGGPGDPTVWLLRAVGHITPHGLELYAVAATSAALASLTAALIFLLVDELCDRRAALAAGLTYSTMVQPLSLGLMGFTHDHLQLAIMAASLLAAVLAVKARGLPRALWAELYAVLVYLGFRANPTMVVSVAVAGAYVGQNVVSWLSRRMGWDVGGTNRFYSVVVLAAIALAGFTIIPAALSPMLQALPQGRYGSGDLIPVTPLALWLRYNILLFMLPFALIAAQKRGDVVAWTTTLIGFALAFYMDRGTRILDVGAAILTGYALADWDARWKAPYYSRKERLKTTLTWSAIVYLALMTLTPTRIGYGAIFLAGGALMLHLLRTRGGLAAVAAVCAVGFAINVMYVYNVEPAGSEAEYSAYRWLHDNNVGGMVLTSWDRGYMAEVITGLNATSTPNRIIPEAHDALWKNESEAAATLRGYGIRYVILKSRGIEGPPTVVGLQIGSSNLAMRPKAAMRLPYLPQTAVYRMVEGTADDGLRLVHEVDDWTSASKLMIYEVSD